VSAISVATKIPEDLVDFLESGVSILVGTRNAKNEPEATRACGARISKDRTQVELFFPDWVKRAPSDIQENGEVAVCFSRFLDNYSIQLKGGGASIRDATDGERSVPERYIAAYIETLSMVGFPRSLTTRIRVWPAKVVSFPVRDIFVQTPGPKAGERL
jgi:hypothetical protein